MVESLHLLCPQAPSADLAVSTTTSLPQRTAKWSSPSSRTRAPWKP
ncbi:proline-rich receptor-like protein kinase PERK2 [Iris pallida]|uniref:Proline-rich receptor-like protein kinase PERK2 n=1 Tax=Iris pallida TaxID=29817 RepID=A0AAX6FGN2_IRIPA|nr:proline-rich receptor-like protein kinase PERK2 [Iris pallida]KAJ6843650.1 proline-rich receptor-like protein kinase PERK2 [Iris pallida]